MKRQNSSEEMIRFADEREKSSALGGEARQKESRTSASGNRYPLPL
jgi:hypothetical protein